MKHEVFGSSFLPLLWTNVATVLDVALESMRHVLSQGVDLDFL